MEHVNVKTYTKDIPKGFWDDLQQSGENLVISITDAAGQVVGSYGTTQAALADNAQALADYNAGLLDHAALIAQLEAERERERRKMIYTLMAITVIFGFILLAIMNRKK